jgi:DeoR family glycerol-3-phosphate regulon repressor/DeoR family fructose operon transcriptional repressor
MIEREKDLLSLLEVKKYVSVNDLCKKLFVSEATIRRDLNSLEKQGLIRRTRGGAFYIENNHLEWPLLYKNKENIDKKIRIANLAIDFVKDGQTLFIDSSSTCLYFTRRLSEKKDLTVLTNGITTSNLLSDETDVNVYCACGQVYSKRSSINGPETCDYILRHKANIAFTSCRGLDANFGASDFSEGESMVKKSFHKRADKTILLVDSSKFNQTFFNQTFSIQDIDVAISDKEFPENIALAFNKYNIQMVW